MIKVGDKFVHLGTAWSTDRGRQGSYNLYYSTADKITGPYAPENSPVASSATARPSKTSKAAGGAPPSSTPTGPLCRAKGSKTAT